MWSWIFILYIHSVFKVLVNGGVRVRFDRQVILTILLMCTVKNLMGN